MSQVVAASDPRAPVIGRDNELTLLLRAAESAKNDGTVRTMTLVGPPGIGKTRLAEEFARRGPENGVGPLRTYRSAAPAQSSSYGVFTRLLRSRFGLLDGAEPAAQAEQLRTEVAKVLSDRRVGDVCFLLGELVGVDFPESPLTKALAEDESQARLLRRAVVRSFIEADAQTSPLCLLFDDLHHADADSVDLLSYLIENAKGPILLVCLARPEFLSKHEAFAKFGMGRHEVLEIGPVSEDDSAKIMEALLAPCIDGPPEQLVEAGIGMAGGTPGLLEHMLRIFLDSGVLQEQQGATPGTRSWTVDLDRLANARLPLTVEDAVRARLSALSPDERRLLEHAASMGSVFWLGGLVALRRIDRPAPEFWQLKQAKDVAEIEGVLKSLVERDYVLELPDSAFSDEIEYIFKHNLEREKIAQLTNPAAARRQHQTIADWLAQKETVRNQEEYAAMLARHLESAGSLTRAAFAYLDAGNIARQHYAAKKAHEYYLKGLAVLGSDDARRCIDALHNHGDVLLLLGRTDEALGAFREMLAIAYRLGLKAKGGAAHNRIGRVFRDTGSLGQALEHLETGLELFDAVQDQRGVAASRDDIGKLLWMRGEYEEALEELTKALNMRKALGDGRSIALSLNNIGLVWRDHGQEGQAREALEAALKIRRELSDPLGIVESLNDLGLLALDQGEHQKALSLFKEGYSGAKDIGDHNRIAVLLTNIGEAHQRMGQSPEAVRVLTQAEELCDDLGDKLHLAEAKRGLAKAYLEQKELRKAREAIKIAVDLFGQVRSKPHLAVALRTLGEVTGAGAWGDGHEVKAVDYFMRSIAICKEIGNELEVAKSYRAFSSYVFSSAHYRQNADIQREASKLNEMADEIFERHRIKNRPSVV